ncbi:MAG: hypothetical protein K2X68_02630 [Novosphingobium sp.]|nr:hypothetical protein [Novosphingobium sp.]
MPKAYSTVAEKPKTRTERNCGENRTGVRWNIEVMRVARTVWPVKTAWNLHNLTGYGLRSCEYWLEGRSAIPSDALVALIRSHWGREFLAGLMVQAQPRWWVKVCSYFSALDAMAMQRIARRRLKEAVDADSELSASIARADALLVHDEDFYRPHLDGVRAMGGVPDRALAPTGSRRRR